MENGLSRDGDTKQTSSRCELFDTNVLHVPRENIILGMTCADPRARFVCMHAAGHERNAYRFSPTSDRISIACWQTGWRRLCVSTIILSRWYAWESSWRERWSSWGTLEVWDAHAAEFQDMRFFAYFFNEGYPSRPFIWTFKTQVLKILLLNGHPRVNYIKLPHLGHTLRVSTTFLIFC
jgi:hypothetical protein